MNTVAQQTLSGQISPRRKAVVFIINSLTGGGAERVMSQLLQSSRPWGDDYDLHLILLDMEPDAYPLPPWITVHRLDSRFSVFRALYGCFLLLRRLQPAVCLSFLTRANVVSIAISRLLGFGIVVSERVSPSSHHGARRGGKAARMMTRLMYPLADRVICPSAGVARDLAENFGVDLAKTAVIANPLDIDAIERLASGPAPRSFPTPYIVTVGRLVENKNCALLLAALKLKKTRGELDLVVIGAGPLRAVLQRQVEELGLEGRVHFTGFLENPFVIMKAARMFVLPSNAEGFPNALLEAMALGVPAISTNCRSGPSELLDDCEHPLLEQPHNGRYGMLVPVADAEALATAIDAMAEDATRTFYSSAALSGALRFAGKPVAERYWNVIESTFQKSIGKSEKKPRALPERDPL